MRKKEDIEKIYGAALGVFAEFGYKKSTLEDIASRLGMTKGNMYVYAKSKEDLYQQTVSNALIKWQTKVREYVESETNVKQQFLVMWYRAVEYLSESNDLRRILVRDPDIFPMFPEIDPFHEINQASVDMVRRILVRGMEEGLFRTVDPDKTAEVIFYIYKMLIIRAYIKEERKEIQEMFVETIELLTTGLFLDPDI